MKTNLRPSPIAGTWYPANPQRLAAEVDSYLNAARLPALDGEVVGIIAPHAGHRYSGKVAGYAFAAARGLRPELVVLLSPFHAFAPFPLLTTSHAAYATPLGNIPVAADLLSRLGAALKFPVVAIAHDQEHSLEIELPFLQRIFPQPFRLLPLMLRLHEPKDAAELGDALAEILKDKNALLVASTDLSHFYDSQAAKKLDEEMLARFAALDPDAIFAAEQTGAGFACGHAAVAAMLHAAKRRGANKVQILQYGTSRDVSGDSASVVGYGAAAVLRAPA